MNPQSDMVSEVKTLTGIRRVAARRMTEAWVAPMFHLNVQVDMTNVLTLGRSLPDATVTDLLLYACSRALLEHPALNAHYDRESVTEFRSVNLGLAVDTEQGLTVPVIHGLESLSLQQLGERRKDVVSRARLGKLTMADVEGGTFTVSNLGMLGVGYFDAILNPPQVCILAVGSTQDRVVPLDGQVAVRPCADLTLTCDHRAVDGAAGARFLATLRRLLEAEPPWPIR